MARVAPSFVCVMRSGDGVNNTRTGNVSPERTAECMRDRDRLYVGFDVLSSVCLVLPARPLASVSVCVPILPIYAV